MNFRTSRLVGYHIFFLVGVQQMGFNKGKKLHSLKLTFSPLKNGADGKLPTFHLGGKVFGLFSGRRWALAVSFRDPFYQILRPKLLAVLVVLVKLPLLRVTVVLLLVETTGPVSETSVESVLPERGWEPTTEKVGGWKIVCWWGESFRSSQFYQRWWYIPVKIKGGFT